MVYCSSQMKGRVYSVLEAVQTSRCNSDLSKFHQENSFFGVSPPHPTPWPGNNVKIKWNNMKIMWNNVKIMWNNVKIKLNKVKIHKVKIQDLIHLTRTCKVLLFFGLRMYVIRSLKTGLQLFLTVEVFSLCDRFSSNSTYVFT